MVTLERIKRENNIISAIYYPEDADGRGRIAVNVDTKEVVDFSEVAGYGACGSSKYHGRNKLLEIAHMDPLPERAIALWY